MRLESNDGMQASQTENDCSKQTESHRLSIAMLCIHSSPLGALGTQDTGGMSIVVRETAKALGAQGHRTDIYTAAVDGTPAIVPLYPNVRLIHLQRSGHPRVSKADIFPYLPRYHQALEAFISAENLNYDLLHSHYWLSGRLGLWIQESRDLPHVISFHTLGRIKVDSWPQEVVPMQRIEWERRLAEKGHRFLVAAHREKQNLLSLAPVQAAKIGVVPYGVDTHDFDRQPMLEARAHIGLDPYEPVILFVGRFVPIKGLERLLHAVAAVTEPVTPRLVLVGGDGPRAESTERIKRLSQQLGISERVTFKGRIAHTDLGAYYNAADLLALCSYYESFGLVALEALACGTPVVGTPVGVIDTVVKQGLNGAIVSGDTPQAIASALAKVLRWRRHGRLPSDRVRASIMKYTWPKVAAATCGQYYQTLKQRAGAK
jgi:D-inositol-3-phosphate glycosyltransferase